MINILGLMLVAGLIAYISDVLGRKMGRKRLTVLHLRPRTTATLGTVLTGMFITVVTIMLFAIVNENVYDALFRVEKLKIDILDLQNEVGDLQNERAVLQAERTDLLQTKSELTEKIGQYTNERKELMKQVVGLRSRLTGLETKLIRREQEYAELKGSNYTLKTSIDELKVRVRDLSEERDRRIGEIQQLRNDIKSKERASLVFRAGALIVEKVIMPKDGPEQSLEQLKDVIRSAHAIARKREVDVRDFDEFWQNYEENFTIMANKLSETYEQSLTGIVIGVLSSENIFKGEQIGVEIRWSLNELLFEKDTLLRTFSVDSGKSREAIASLVEYQIDSLGEEAYEKGRLSTSLDVDRLVLYDAVNAIYTTGEEVDISVYADDDIHVSSPVSIRIEIVPVEKPIFIEPAGETLEVHEDFIGFTPETIKASGLFLGAGESLTGEPSALPGNSELSREASPITVEGQPVPTEDMVP